MCVCVRGCVCVRVCVWDERLGLRFGHHDGPQKDSSSEFAD